MHNGYGYEPEERCTSFLFRYFLYIGVTVLLGLQLYPFISGQNGIESDFLDIKYVAMQLSRGLAELNRKHEKLHSELRRISEEEEEDPAGTAASVRTDSPNVRSQLPHDLHVYDYDRQMADFALETTGARVIDTGSTVEHFVYESPASWMLYALSSAVSRGCVGATTMLQPGTLPGECWAFKTGSGEATIRLIATVQVAGVSLEHIPAHISPRGDISSAPRQFVVQGLKDLNDPHPFEFGSFEYDKDGPPNQYFEVRPTTKGYNLVRLKIVSNWGHPVYTCVYRFRVHGRLARDNTAHATDDEELQISNE
ncbi:SUN domain-containing protein 2-like [Aricia agestis]|uniref:SUN domain-containing protein 2-like n=1 Tax=Aricia agestis TaxID=91739 RepID=UPI001C2052DC|nr:SUN domain-containing protein 2-like [Aricia agestis]